MLLSEFGQLRPTTERPRGNHRRHFATARILHPILRSRQCGPLLTAHQFGLQALAELFTDADPRVTADPAEVSGHAGAIQIAFTDTTGLRWQRDDIGLLHEVPSSFDFADAEERFVDRDIPSR